MDEMVTIASGNSWEADMMKMYLESQGITVYLKGEFIGSIAAHLAAPGGAGAVQVQVPAAQAEQAKALLSENG